MHGKFMRVGPTVARTEQGNNYRLAGKRSITFRCFAALSLNCAPGEIFFFAFSVHSAHDATFRVELLKTRSSEWKPITSQLASAFITYLLK